MEHTLRIELKPERGALLRVLALIERRGFVIARVDASSADVATETPTHAQVRVRGRQPVAVLARQLQRLLDVRDAHVVEAPDQTTVTDR